METYYLILVAFLFILATFDLFVGVSNDAVNFLNSAIGAKVAKFKTILMVAGVGIFIGAATSSGMMDVARHGMFHPEFFTFQQIMIIFVAVVSSDIVLMDIFNSLGMPTSTTVSMVFELLGGTFAISLMKISQDPTNSLGALMNTEKAISVVFAIFISVAIAFFFGLLLQYISRLIFTFTYKNNGLRWKIGLFGGVAGTAIMYFLLIKGFGKSSIITPEMAAWIETNTAMLMLWIFIGMTLLMYLLHFLKVNVFRVLVLMGTFALAMAFAGNDLVNFIGVCLAGFSSFQDFTAHGFDPSTFMMDSLNGPSDTPTLFLIAAGAIMVIALATSKKAHNVVKTSVGLSSQDSGDEMFGSSKAARVIVRACTNFANSVESVIPEKTKAWIETRFNNEDLVLPKGAAFDEIRASVSLVVASLLIALGTSLKLPLSTTYVTFMVGMGSALADRAWGRETAVFRVTGVLSVIGGWFITAGAAFTLAFFVALIMFWGGKVGTIIMICLALFLVIRSNVRDGKAGKEEQADELFDEILVSEDQERTMELLSQHVLESHLQFLKYTEVRYKDIVDAFMKDNLKPLENAEKSLRLQRTELKKIRRKEIIGLRRVDPEIAIEKNTWMHIGHNSCEELLYCLKRILDPCLEHVDNNFVALDQERIKEFVPLRDTLLFMVKRVHDLIAAGSYKDHLLIKEQLDELDDLFSDARKVQLNRIQSSKENLTIAYVYLNMIQESQQLIISIRHLFRASRHFHTV